MANIHSDIQKPWRRLTHQDVIQRGDEYAILDEDPSKERWVACDATMIGRSPAFSDRLFRRLEDPGPAQAGFWNISLELRSMKVAMTEFLRSNTALTHIQSLIDEAAARFDMDAAVKRSIDQALYLEMERKVMGAIQATLADPKFRTVLLDAMIPAMTRALGKNS